jgi:hypothetical protein
MVFILFIEQNKIRPVTTLWQLDFLKCNFFCPVYAGLRREVHIGRQWCLKELVSRGGRSESGDILKVELKTSAASAAPAA